MDVAAVAVAAAALFAAIALFQLALVVGAPWGTVAYGGRVALDDGRLPSTYRFSSAVAAVLLVVFAVVVLVRGGVVGSSGDAAVVRVTSWVVVGFMALNTAANLAARHWVERFVLGGTTALLGVACSVVAAAGPT
ncbi:MAG: hypothetical protein IE926_10700 [Micrococcales bacterium]|uniref:hypothetical protein n=1 Tax=Phycicoccus sp. TaxID=1902410 RepID=UPI00199BDA22|nr:hypothetical protein [Phycicoccus sp.]MBD3783406.1 hypothetical protein [Micrococcales bacterium]HMM96992.1 hypothetical protein [Phycicoccus sp.]